MHFTPCLRSRRVWRLELHGRAYGGGCPQYTIHLVTNNYPRLAMIRKVGLASNNSKRNPRERAWVPLPLRNRISGGWS